MSLEDKILNVIKNDVNNIGIEIKEVKYLKENGVNYLRIFINQSTNQKYLKSYPANVTNLINPILDKYDFIDEPYMLDISSVSKGGNYE